ncbi:hypothetical protein TRVL_08298 [Trypanosoma vivax]|nr:hypothetical protein TRVL_08298 [Trypanosoma vivax]
MLAVCAHSCLLRHPLLARARFHFWHTNSRPCRSSCTFLPVLVFVSRSFVRLPLNSFFSAFPSNIHIPSRATTARVFAPKRHLNSLPSSVGFHSPFPVGRSSTVGAKSGWRCALRFTTGGRRSKTSPHTW